MNVNCCGQRMKRQLVNCGLGIVVDVVRGVASWKCAKCGRVRTQRLRKAGTGLRGVWMRGSGKGFNVMSSYWFRLVRDSSRSVLIVEQRGFTMESALVWVRKLFIGWRVVFAGYAYESVATFTENN